MEKFELYTKQGPSQSGSWWEMNSLDQAIAVLCQPLVLSNGETEHEIVCHWDLTQDDMLFLVLFTLLQMD